MSEAPGRGKHTNGLINESSPYLLQHAHNPVDWRPWNPEAFARARELDRPILLSVGYSACHWCHVMERESFENEEIAQIMNREFVCIKVDREERPDVDSIYMSAVQMMTGQGGWPMTVFLTPEAVPFYGGTYFPPEDQYGRPGFRRILLAVAEAWASQREGLTKQAGELLSHLNSAAHAGSSPGDPSLNRAGIDDAFKAVARSFDRKNGGFGAAPKFPQPSVLAFVLHYYYISGSADALEMAQITLDKMACGGMFDQLGGGFHRYSTDAVWLVPHFEKMLYDNAQLAQIYARAYLVTQSRQYLDTCCSTLDYILREMTGPEGEFYSSQDADSEGEEGKFFVWSRAEILQELGEDAAKLFCELYGVTERGNWEGANILNRTDQLDAVANQSGDPQARAAIERSRAQLLAARVKRIPPGLDDKALTAWNGLTLAALAECAAVFGREDYKKAACRNAEFVMNRLSYRDDAKRLRLRRAYRMGAATLNGYLEDYAHYCDGVLWLYQLTFETRWIDLAQDLMRAMVDLFWDPQASGFFTTSSDHEPLIQRLKDTEDNATPSGNSVAAQCLLRLYRLTELVEYRDLATGIFNANSSLMARFPQAFARAWCGVIQSVSPQIDIAIVGGSKASGTMSLLQTVRGTWLPNGMVVVGDQEERPKLPLLEGRSRTGDAATAFVCVDRVCSLPVTKPDDLSKLLST